MRYTSVLLAAAVGLTGCESREPPASEPRADATPAAERQLSRDATSTPTEVPAFADIDVDGDGFLSAEETREVPELRDIFALADRDLDGRLSVAEFSQATLEGFRVSPEAARGPLFTALDEDKDGAITRDEAQAVPQLAARFSELDTDGDGRLDLAEYTTALDAGLVNEG